MHFAKIEPFLNMAIANVESEEDLDDNGQPIDVDEFVGFQTNVEFRQRQDSMDIKVFIDEKINEAMNSMGNVIYSVQQLQVALCVVTTGIVNRFLYKETEKRLYYFDCMERKVKYRNLENLETIDIHYSVLNTSLFLAI